MKVYAISAADRPQGVSTLLKKFDLESFKTQKIAIKANFNSADPFPASTHYDTLESILNVFSGLNCKIVLAERSGMGKTQAVLSGLGISDLVSRYKGEIVIIDSLQKNDFKACGGDHWSQKFLLANKFVEADHVISTCCLKTHRFGGYFTLSLKNSVGAIARYRPGDEYDYMKELHESSHQREMIAEINAHLPCDIVILDAKTGFSTMGPEQGHIIEPGILLASTDRVAIDVVGVALLRYYRTTPEVEKGKIFEQDQIKRAVELGIGVTSPEEIEVEPLDETSEEVLKDIKIS
ncbi:MAG: DUF362 domain-containing protein [Candidatus Methanofastidiosia archaeon]|jgi:uncharacterized protein (DUF362 family)